MSESVQEVIADVMWEWADHSWVDLVMGPTPEQISDFLRRLTAAGYVVVPKSDVIADIEDAMARDRAIVEEANELMEAIPFKDAPPDAYPLLSTPLPAAGWTGLPEGQEKA